MNTIETKIIALQDGQQIYAERYHKRYRLKAATDIAIIILHGGPAESCVTFADFALLMADCFDLILFDQRGVLRSSSEYNPEKIRIKRYVSDLKEIQQAYGIEKAVLFAHCFGAQIAIRYAAAYPERVSSLILENPCIDVFDSLQNIILRYRKYFSEIGEKGLAEKMGKALVTNSTREKLSIVNSVPKGQRMRFWGNEKLSNKHKTIFSFSGFSQEQKAQSANTHGILLQDKDLRENGWEYLDQVFCPILLFYGEKDSMLSPEMLERFFSGQDNRKGSEIREGGHYLHMSNIHEMKAGISSFFCRNELLADGRKT